MEASMKKDKNYWEPIYDDFVQRYPELVEQMIDWYPSGQLEIAIRLKTGQKYIYDWLENLLVKIYDPDDMMKETEEEWEIKFSNNLKRKLRNVGMTQDLLAFETGISVVTINKYTNGKSMPNAYNLRKIANALKCSLYELTD